MQWTGSELGNKPVTCFDCLCILNGLPAHDEIGFKTGVMMWLFKP